MIKKYIQPLIVVLYILNIIIITYLINNAIRVLRIYIYSK